MDYKLWENSPGRSPVKKELLDLAQKDMQSVKAIGKNFKRFEKLSYENLRKSKTIDKLQGKNPNKIHYYRISLPKKIARIFFIIKGSTAVFLHLIIKKSDDIKNKERSTAEDRAKIAILEE